jgi:hypothetical protein
MRQNLKRLCAGLALLGALGPVHAYTWTFTNSGQTWRATDGVALEARVTNDAASPFSIDSDRGFDPAITFVGRLWPQQYFFGFGDFSELRQKTLAPGESVAFRFGNLVPFGIVRPDDYQVAASLSLNGVEQAAAFSFAISPVPEPAAYTMMALGVLLVGGLARRSRPC